MAATVKRPNSAKAGAARYPVLQRLLAAHWLAIVVAAVIAAACFDATGGLSLGPTTAVEIALTLIAGVLVALAIIASADGSVRVFGLGAAAAFFALALFSALSVAWSVEPNTSWIDANETLSYAAAFVGAIAMVRLFSGRWRSIIVGVLIGAVVVCAYALAAKVFPAASPAYARLSAPFDDWNAVGLTAALGIPACLWLGARREGSAWVNCLAAPSLCLLFVALVLSYSRGSLLAAGVGMAVWFVATPLRLRAVALSALSAVAAAVVLVWALSQHALSTDGERLAPRASAGHELGLVLIAVLILCTAASFALQRAVALRTPPSPQLRRRVGTALLVAVALIPLGGAVGLAASSRGLFGSVSNAWQSVTNTKTAVVSNGSSRLSSLDSTRALYWDDALKIWRGSPTVGTGAGGYGTAFLRYAHPGTIVTDAHGYVFETLADLGLIGLALSLALAGAWLVATLRAIRRVGPPPDLRADNAERIGLLTLAACVVTFTVHSAIDYTWFVPGDAVVALLCAGWIAGRGPHTAAVHLRQLSLATLRKSSRVTAGAAVLAIVIALVFAWDQWQPLRSLNDANAGLAAAVSGRLAQATSDEDDAISTDPLDYQPELNLGYIDFAAGRIGAGHVALERGVVLQPSNPYTWAELAAADLNYLNNPAAALNDVGPALYLYPTYPFSLAVYNAAVAKLNSEATAVSRGARHHAHARS